jgi:hypothetical protein
MTFVCFLTNTESKKGNENLKAAFPNTYRSEKRRIWDISTIRKALLQAMQDVHVKLDPGLAW